MRAMILAAGKGERLRPLTDTCPKPLVKVGGKPLIVYHIEKLSRVGITDIVINVSHLGQQICEYLGEGQQWNVNLTYSWEQTPLEVGGGIFQALPILGPDPFLVVNGDIWVDYSLSNLPSKPKGLAHLVLVNNPPHNLAGDFVLQTEGKLSLAPEFPKLTYAGISLIHPELFADCKPGSFRLRPLFDKAISQGLLYGEHYLGAWTDVGTLERLQSLEKALACFPL